MTVPRLVIAGVSSGVGKTTVVTALIGVLRARGLRVAAFKCGPDYLDPTYHARAAGSPSHNLDGWMMGRDAVLSTFERTAKGADIAIIEGVMGLFDGASPTGEEGSTAEIAKWLSAPVLVTIDASGMARTVAAVAHGISAFDSKLSVAGFICNRVGSKGHLDLLRKALPGKIHGGFPKQAELAFPERHLGLRTASEDAIPEKLLKGWADLAHEWLDVEKILAIARTAVPSPLEGEGRVERSESGVRSGSRGPRHCRIGLAYDEAFHFYYEDNLARLEDLGAELVRFSPVKDKQLPEVDGLYFGGGYPEVHASQLSRNESMLESVRRFASANKPVYAECGGLMYLSHGIKTLDGQLFPMVRLIPIETVMCAKLQALGYVEVETQEPSILGAAGLRFRGHQFRYSEPRLISESIQRIYTLRRRRAGEVQNEGYRVNNVLASYVHAHWASNPLAAEGFVKSCIARHYPR